MAKIKVIYFTNTPPVLILSSDSASTVHAHRGGTPPWMEPTMPTTSWSMLFQSHRAAHTLLLMLGVGVPATSVFIVSTVLPSVVADIGGAAFYAWSSMLYTVASILGTASGGFIRATLDLRRGYMMGALVFVVGAVGCALAPHMLVLVGARAIQGWGGGVLVSLSYGIARVLYPEDLRPRVLATMSGVWGVAAFWVLVPVITLVLYLVWHALPGAAPQGQVPHVPLLRLALLGIGMLCVAWSG